MRRLFLSCLALLLALPVLAQVEPAPDRAGGEGEGP